MKIVKFKDGNYAIKRGWWIFSDFVDLRAHYYWKDPYLVSAYCKTKDLDLIKKLYESINIFMYEDVTKQIIESNFK